ncbi:MAG: antitoxin [Actinomycetota bacterium]|nr:antitoxin [Actinomycetota bacterium]MDQ3715745.1 antitoxin [Actinomycetota bacterium]
MGTFDNLKGKVSDLVDQHSDKIEKGMDKAGEFVDSKTGGKHTEHIATGKDKLRDALDGLDGKNDDFPDTATPSATGPLTDPPPPRLAH